MKRFEFTGEAHPDITVTDYSLVIHEMVGDRLADEHNKVIIEDTAMLALTNDELVSFVQDVVNGYLSFSGEGTNNNGTNG